MSEKRLSAKHVHGFALASGTFTIMMMTAATYYNYFLTDVALVSSATVGTILMIARLADAVSIPITGAIIQKNQFRWGQFRSWLLFVPTITAIFFMLMFTNFNMPSTQKGILLGVIYIIAHVLVNMSFNAYMGLIPKMGANSEDRVLLSSRRSQYTAVFNVILSLSVLPLVAFFGKLTPSGNGWFGTITLYSILMVIGYFVTFTVTKEYDPYNPDLKLGKGEGGISTSDMVKDVFGNSQLMILMAADLFRYAATFSITGLAAYFFTYVAQNLEIMPIFMSSLYVASFLVATIAAQFLRKFDKKKVFMASLTIQLVFMLLAFFMVDTNIILFTVFAAISYAGVALPNNVAPPMYADVATYGQKKTGRNLTGFIMSLSAFPIKIGMLISGSIIGYGLAIIGYETAETVVTPQIADGIKFLFVGMPIVGGILALVFMFLYKLNNDTMAEIKSELEQKSVSM